ncbi:hypothetical protein H9Y04_21700 [Streptomyces sp. TRM66268-LWL]|uniref:Endonuclease/exonuclease/phosphatase domain-containing protein n=1 Tax=Streptomyces polyasparticus TaxID=2767826 RepID=A0ABR7SJP3_9ACTN|nr:hypothetical protein [Streptomyces polyasparticus]MBC9715169.1 hypothetical protein [Streptomyces polyasparticus]
MLTRFLVPAAAAPVALGPAVVPAQAAEDVQSVPDRVAVLSWNICGTAGRCPSRENPKAKLDEIMGIAEADPGYAVIMIQEASSPPRARPALRTGGTDYSPAPATSSTAASPTPTRSRTLR